MFKITSGKGFQVTFKNGLTLSTQFDRINYCDNKGEINNNSCMNAEIAVWDSKNKWITGKILKKVENTETKELVEIDGTEEVIGWISPDTWLEIAYACKNYKE